MNEQPGFGRQSSDIDGGSSTRQALMRAGMRDPFIQGIIGIVAIATAIGIAVKTLGDGKNTIIAISLALIFGVVLIVFRVLIININNTVVRWLCIFSSVTLTGVFLIFVILTLPAVTFCWPPLYANFLGVHGCANAAGRPKMSDLRDQNGNYVGIYPEKFFGYQENINNAVIYSLSRSDKRTLMKVESFPNDVSNFSLENRFEVLRKLDSKTHTFCLLRDKMFVVSFVTYDNRIHYVVGRNKNQNITVISAEYDIDLKWEFDKFLTDLLQYFIGDLNRSKLVRSVCADS
jgi:hypothetical protein